MWENNFKSFFWSQFKAHFWNLWEKEMRLYALYLIWKYLTLTSLTLLLMRENLTGALSSLGASIISQGCPKNWALSSDLTALRNDVSLRLAFLFTFGRKFASWVFCVEILEGFKILPYVCQGGFWIYTRQISKGKLWFCDLMRCLDQS